MDPTVSDVPATFHAIGDIVAVAAVTSRGDR